MRPARHRLMLVPAILVVWAAVLGPVWPAIADPRDISVGGVWITRLTHDVAGYTSFQRAVEVGRRITEVLSTPKFRQGTTVSVQTMGKAALVTVGDVLVFTVTPDDAEGTSVTPLTLARQWAQRLAEGLGNALPDAKFHVF